MEKRQRGETMKKNQVKLAIMLFIGDKTISGSDIRDHLRKLYRIRESRGVRAHLSSLCEKGYLDKTTKVGIETYYRWKTEIDSFRKIIDLISNNSKLIKNIIKERRKENKLNQSRVMTLIKPSAGIDVTRYWYNTAYAKLFFTSKTIDTVIETAYADYSKNKHDFQLNKSNFKHIILEGIDNQTLVTLMYHSPNLVKYIIDLRNRYKEKTRNLKRVTDQIFFTTIHDILFDSTAHHVDFGFMEGHKLPRRPLSVRFVARRSPISKKVENGVFKGVELKFDYSLPAPGIQNLIKREGT